MANLRFFTYITKFANELVQTFSISVTEGQVDFVTKFMPAGHTANGSGCLKGIIMGIAEGQKQSVFLNYFYIIVFGFGTGEGVSLQWKPRKVSREVEFLKIVIMSYDDYDENAMYGDYEIPFPGMSREDFLYRAMNPEDPMYMGPEDEEEYDEDEEEYYDEEYDDEYEEYEDDEEYEEDEF